MKGAVTPGLAMRALICFVIFVAVLGVGLSREIGKAFTRPSESTALAAPGSASSTRTASARPAPAPAASSSSRTVTLESDSRGHFAVDARIDGRRIDVVVDTGASLVVINESSAAKLGIFPKPADYTGRSQTANGISKYAPVRLSRVEINGITVRDVAAAVKSDDALKVNLLGMSFLSKVKFTHDRGRLVLEQ